MYFFAKETFILFSPFCTLAEEPKHHRCLWARCYYRQISGLHPVLPWLFKWFQFNINNFTIHTVSEEGFNRFPENSKTIRYRQNVSKSSLKAETTQTFLVHENSLEISVIFFDFSRRCKQFLWVLVFKFEIFFPGFRGWRELTGLRFFHGSTNNRSEVKIILPFRVFYA